MKDFGTKIRQVARTGAVPPEELAQEQDLAQLQQEQSRLQKKRLRVHRRMFRRSRELYNKD